MSISRSRSSSVMRAKSRPRSRHTASIRPRLRSTSRSSASYPGMSLASARRLAVGDNWSRAAQYLFFIHVDLGHAPPPSLPVFALVATISRRARHLHLSSAPHPDGPVRRWGEVRDIHPRRWGVREPPGAAPGTDGRGHGYAGGSPPHRREQCPLTPKKRPGPPSQIIPQRIRLHGIRPTHPHCRRIENPLQGNQAVTSLKVSGTLCVTRLHGR